MGKPVCISLIAVLAFSISTTARAQRGESARGGGSYSAAPARSSGSSHSGHMFTGVKITSKPSGARSETGSASTAHVYLYGANGTLTSSLPGIGGLGFDCEKLGCNSGSNTGHNRRFGALTGAYLITGYGGYYYPSDYDASQGDAQSAQTEDQPQQQPQPQIIIIQQPMASAQPAPEESAVAAPEPEPTPDIGDFTLILKNGTQLTAVAFTRRNDQLVYITREGSRRTVEIADLDAAATTKLNDERGTPFKLPIKSDAPSIVPPKSNNSSS
jgi:hypothetical protein